MKIITRSAIPMSRLSNNSYTRSQNSIGRIYSQWNVKGIGKHMSQISVPGCRYSQWKYFKTYSSYDYPHNI